MTRGFDADLPARKPRTKIGRVLSELTADPQPDAGLQEDLPLGRGEAPDEDYDGAASRGNGVPELPSGTPAAGRGTRDAAAAVGGGSSAAPSGAPSKRTAVLAPRVSRGREQIDKLRERLALAAHPRGGVAEPQQTAAAIRDMVGGLRARLETSARERAELSDALDEARAALVRVEADLQKERRTRASLEAQAEERRRIADDAVVEAEALAAERDQVLDELADLRRLEGEQAVLLTEAEAELARRDGEREAAARELAEARELVDIRRADAADLEARLDEEAAGRARAETRCRELEGEVALLSRAREALESIEAMLGRGR